MTGPNPPTARIGDAELASLAAYVRATAALGRSVERVGPFLATFTEDDANPYLSYAIPDDGATPSGDEVATLVATFNRRNRVARFEYFPALCPALGAALAGAGFVTEAVVALMGAGRDDLRREAFAPGFTIRRPVTPGELADAARVQYAAFGQRAPTAPDVAAALTRVLDHGGFVATAIEPGTGRVVGTGTCSAVRRGFGEIAGIAVDEAFRGRRLASSLTASLTSWAFAAGARLVFLTPGGDAAERSYARVGFRQIGDQIHTSLRRPLGAPPDPAAAGY